MQPFGFNPAWTERRKAAPNPALQRLTQDVGGRITGGQLKPFWLIPLLLGIVVRPAPAQGTAQFDQGSIFSVLEENDLMVRTDRHYTQGIKLAYLHKDGSLPGFLRWVDEGIGSFGYEKRTSRFGLQIGQSIYTPSDTSVEELLPEDRPYAGWLYTGLTLQRRGIAAGRWPTLESFELQLGVVGPESLAENAQTWIHKVRDIELPQGWDNQLKTEPGLELRYWRGWRLAATEASAPYFDFIPHFAANAGNTMISGRVGGMLRLGWNLPDTFGAQTISSLLTLEGGWSPTRTGPRWSFHVFSGAEGWVVAHNVFLDGNLYQNSHSVSKEPWVGELQSGFAVGFRYVQVGFMYVLRSREFETQDKDHQYGSLFLKALF